MSSVQPQFLSTDEHQTKPTLIIETYLGPLRDTDSLKSIRNEFDANKEAFIRKAFRRFFFKTEKIVFGSLAHHSELRTHVEERVRAHPEWVVHAKIPLEVGGAPDCSNMVLMLRETQIKFQADIDAQLFVQRFEHTDLRSVRISIPAYPIYLPCTDGKLRLPILSDDNQGKELELPLDKHSRTQLSHQGFGSLRKKIIGYGRLRPSREDMEEVEASVRQSGRYLGSNNRVQRQHRQFSEAVVKHG